MAFNYKEYWESRYKEWWNSGAWSYWDNAIFKADYINKLIKDNNIKSVVEIWCWDWANLSLYKWFDSYLWLDVSDKAIELAKKINNGSKYKFSKYNWDEDIKADMTLCLDVTYHIFPMEEWKRVINNTIDIASDIVVFYSFPCPTWHVKHINNYNLIEYLKDYCKQLWYSIKYDIDSVPPNSNSRFIIIYKDGRCNSDINCV